MNDASERSDEGAGVENTIKVPASLLERAKRGEREAIETMVSQFLTEDEEVQQAEYLGARGLWIFAEHCWGCLTSRRAGTLRVGKAGEVIYQDALLEGFNSCVIYQPGLTPLYVLIVVLVIAAIPTFGITLLLIPLGVHVFHKYSKCGLWFVVREGQTVYMYCNRKRITVANRLYRSIIAAREERVDKLANQLLAARL